MARIVIAFALVFMSGVTVAEEKLWACMESGQATAMREGGVWKAIKLQSEKIVIKQLDESPYLHFGEQSLFQSDSCEKLFSKDEVIIQCYEPYAWFNFNTTMGVVFQTISNPNGYMSIRYFECEAF